MKSTLSIALLVVAASCFILPFVNAVDWPKWRGVERDGTSTQAVLEEKRRHRNIVRAVSVGRLYTVGNKGNLDVVYCLNAATGAEIGKHTYPQSLDPRQFEGGPAGTPTVDGERVYTLGHEGDLFCLSAATGRCSGAKTCREILAAFARNGDTPARLWSMAIWLLSIPAAPAPGLWRLIKQLAR